MQILGNRNINNTLICTHVVNFKDDNYTAKVAHSEEEVAPAAGFVCSGLGGICTSNLMAKSPEV
jgi:hypothetical protein